MFPIWLISDVFGYNFFRKVQISLKVLEKCLRGCLNVFPRSSVSSDVSLILWKTLHYEIILMFCCLCDKLAIEQGRLMSLAQTAAALGFKRTKTKGKMKASRYDF